MFERFSFRIAVPLLLCGIAALLLVSCLRHQRTANDTTDEIRTIAEQAVRDETCASNLMLSEQQIKTEKKNGIYISLPYYEDTKLPVGGYTEAVSVSCIEILITPTVQCAIVSAEGGKSIFLLEEEAVREIKMLYKGK